MADQMDKIARLHQIIRKQKLIVDSLPAMIAYWDENEVCQFANKAYIDWFGFDPDLLIGRSMTELFGPHLYEKNKPYIKGALSGELQKFERELIFGKTQKMRYTSAIYIPDIKNGKGLGFFALVSDITDLKEAQLLAVAEKDNAVRASQIKSRFLANMSHEIRTPMTGLLGMLELLGDTELNEKQNDYLKAAGQSAKHLLLIIDDILDISKIEAGHMTLSKKPFDLRASLLSALAAPQIAAAQKGVRLDLTVSESIPSHVVGDSTRVLQIVLNLVSNALKFTDRGRVHVHVDSDEKDANEILFSVSDTGRGIAKESQSMIFEPFRQAEDGSTRFYQGTGLGLSICRSLIEKMGGQISVESEMAVGSKFQFRVRLPSYAMLKPLNLPEKNEFPFAQFSKLRLLLAEDIDVVAKAAEAMLSALNCEVTVVDNGLSAVKESQNSSYDLAFFDMQMPGIDGPEASRRIRELEKKSGAYLPIVALTANAMDDHKDECIAAGMDDFLTKPFTKQRLSDILFRVLQQKASRFKMRGQRSCVEN